MRAKRRASEPCRDRRKSGCFDGALPISDGEESNDSLNNRLVGLSTIDLTEFDDTDSVEGSKEARETEPTKPTKPESSLKSNYTIPKKRVRFNFDTRNGRSENLDDSELDDFFTVTSCNGATTITGTKGNAVEDPKNVVTTKNRIDSGQKDLALDNMNAMNAKLKQELKEVNDRNAALVTQLKELQDEKDRKIDTLEVEKKILINKISEIEKQQVKSVADAQEKYKMDFSKLVEQTKKVKFCSGCGTTKPQDTFYFCDTRCSKQY